MRVPWPTQEEMTELERAEFARWTTQLEISPRHSEPRKEALDELDKLRSRIVYRLKSERNSG